MSSEETKILSAFGEITKVMVTDEDYVKRLEETIGKFLKPIEGIPFHIAIKALYGHQVIPL